MRLMGTRYFTALTYNGLVWFGLVGNGNPIKVMRWGMVGGTSDVVGMVNITGSRDRHSTAQR